MLLNSTVTVYEVKLSCVLHNAMQTGASFRDNSFVWGLFLINFWRPGFTCGDWQEVAIGDNFVIFLTDYYTATSHRVSCAE